MYRAGGTAVVAKRLLDAGLLHGDTLTVTGRTMAEEANAAQETPGQEVIRPLSNPLKSSGGLVILRGNLAPEGCVLKVSGYALTSHRGPARVFDCEEEAFAAVQRQEIKPGDVIVIRYEGPKGGPGMREMLGVTGALVGWPGRVGRPDHGRPFLRRLAWLHCRPYCPGSSPGRPYRGAA
jgi:dihydroxy-acid dehydratase